MKKTKVDPVIDADELRAEYDFSGGVRGKYSQQVRQGTNVVLLEDYVAQAFSDDKEQQAEELRERAIFHQHRELLDKQAEALVREQAQSWQNAGRVRYPQA